MQADTISDRGNPGPAPAASLLRDLWRLGGMDEAALAHVALSGAEPVLPTSFAVGTQPR